MKKLLLMLTLISVWSGIYGQGKIKFQAEIANKNGNSIFINDNANKTIKEIKINEKGIFKGEFMAPAGFYMMFDGVEFAQLYLKPGFDLKLKMDAKFFDESIVFTGKGAAENNLLSNNTVTSEKFEAENMKKSKDEFFQGLALKNKTDIEKLDKGKFDPVFVDYNKKMWAQEKLMLGTNFQNAKIKNEIAGKPSKSFNYVNRKGGKTKLEDFKGKYVYIDVWATWCGPCRAEIPFLKKIEEKYHGKNIEFVSISIDVNKDYEKWKNFVTEKQLGGVQLFADKDWSSDFITSFGINSIPRFLLIDPQGNVVDADAVRPSSPELVSTLDKLLK